MRTLQGKINCTIFIFLGNRVKPRLTSTVLGVQPDTQKEVARKWQKYCPSLRMYISALPGETGGTIVKYLFIYLHQTTRVHSCIARQQPNSNNIK